MLRYDSEDAVCWDIFTAASMGCMDTVKKLADNTNIDVNKKNNGGWSAIMYAAYIGHHNVLKLLLLTGSHIDSRTCDGRTALTLAASCGNYDIVEALIEAGADINSQDVMGWSTLMHACSLGHDEVVKVLLRHRASMDVVASQTGATCLILAANDGHEGIVETLLRSGCDWRRRTTSGQTANSIAMLNGFANIAQLIDKHAAADVAEAKTKASSPSLHDGPSLVNMIYKQEQAGEVVASRRNSYLRHYTAPVCSDDWSEESEFDETLDAPTPSRQTPSLHTFLEELGLEKYYETLEREDIDLEVLATLTEGELKDIGIVKLGARRKLCVGIERLRREMRGNGALLD